MDKQEFGNLLEVNNIEVVYNDIIQVLRGVSLNVPQGGIVALLGTNGAGKTTTLRAISGLLKPENGFIRDGYIKFAGSDITNVLGTQVVKLGPSWCRKGAGCSNTSRWTKISGWGPLPAKTAPRKFAPTTTRCTITSPGWRRSPTAGRVLLRRRAADDRHCPGADGIAEDAHAGRTLPRLAPLLVKEIFENVETINRELDTTILVVEQNAKIACRCPIMPISWSQEKSSWKAPPKSCAQPGCQRVLHGHHPGRRTKILQRGQVLQAPQTLDVVFVITSMEGGHSEKPEDIARVNQELKQVRQQLENAGAEHEVHEMARGLSPGEDIVIFAHENNIDQIFVGIEKKSRTRKLLLGSTAQYIILKAACPVTTIK
jgi:branched-chain amino acid transport system ATP-binding protein